jgi:ATP-binding cassette subfamily G (WHITE) protein 2 (PDR)
MPSYILAKWTLGVAAGLFIGFSFYQADSSTQGLQNVIFSAFMVCTIFSSLVQQVCISLCSQWTLLTIGLDHASLRQSTFAVRSS